jgi:CBS domain-containing protein
VTGAAGESEPAVPDGSRRGLAGSSVAEVMLARPKTLAADATVAEARRLLGGAHVKMLLLAERGLFRAAITHIPAGADPAAAALAYAEQVDPLSPDDAAETALARMRARGERRCVVLGADGALLGLLCLDRSGTGFCRGDRGER